MSVVQPVLSQAFIDSTYVSQLQSYRMYDLLTPAYIGDGTKVFFRGTLYTLMGEDGYEYVKVGYEMSRNPMLMDPISFQTPIYMGGSWKASLTFIKNGRPTVQDIYGSGYIDTFQQLISVYVNSVGMG